VGDRFSPPATPFAASAHLGMPDAEGKLASRMRVREAFPRSCVDSGPRGGIRGPLQASGRVCTSIASGLRPRISGRSLFGSKSWSRAPPDEKCLQDDDRASLPCSDAAGKCQSKIVSAEGFTPCDCAQCCAYQPDHGDRVVHGRPLVKRINAPHSRTERTAVWTSMWTDALAAISSAPYDDEKIGRGDRI
jgi:hypothetical protein